MKDHKTVIAEFNELVNMTASDLESWLKSGDSNSAGWPKDSTEEDETVGHDSGRKIVEILKSNPKKLEDEYTDDQIAHMRKVVAYCKRHLAQETKVNKEKSTKDVRKTKSYASLKNWGHDFLKAEKKEVRSGETKESPGSQEKKSGSAHAGIKRKGAQEPNRANKKRETRNQEGSKASSKRGKVDEEHTDEHQDSKSETGDDDASDASDAEDNGESDRTSVKKDVNDDKEKPGDKGQHMGLSKGDTVSWPWGNGHGQGKVMEVETDEVTITTKNGNQVTRNGKEEDPAVVIDTGKSKAIKLSHELD